MNELELPITKPTAFGAFMLMKQHPNEGLVTYRHLEENTFIVAKEDYVFSPPYAYEKVIWREGTMFKFNIKLWCVHPSFGSAAVLSSTADSQLMYVGREDGRDEILWKRDCDYIGPKE